MGKRPQEGWAIEHRRRTIWILIAFLLVVVGATACGRGRGTPAASRPLPTPIPLPTPLPPLPTLPPPGSSENPLVVLLVTDNPSEGSSDVQALADGIAQATGLVVEGRLTDSYAEARSALCQGTAHVVSLDAFSYLAANQEGCGEVLYIAQVDGKLSTRGQMVTLAGRPIFSVDGFRGFRFCRPGPYSISGWIVPSLMLSAHGLNPLTDLVSVTDSGSDEGVIRMILGLQCDEGATTLGAEAGIPNANRITIIEELPPVPNTTIALSLKLDGPTQSAVRDALRNYEDQIAQLIGVQAITIATDGDYSELRDLVETAGFDLIGMEH